MTQVFIALHRITATGIRARGQVFLRIPPLRDVFTVTHVNRDPFPIAVTCEANLVLPQIIATIIGIVRLANQAFRAARTGAGHD